jgi:hypothetical protein
MVSTLEFRVLQFNPNHDQKTGRFASSPKHAPGIETSSEYYDPSVGPRTSDDVHSIVDLKKFVEVPSITHDGDYEYYTHATRWSDEVDSILKTGLKLKNGQAWLSRPPLVRGRGSGWVVVRIPRGLTREGVDPVPGERVYQEFTVRQEIPPQNVVKAVRTFYVKFKGIEHKAPVDEITLGKWALRNQGAKFEDSDDPKTDRYQYSKLPKKYQKWFHLEKKVEQFNPNHDKYGRFSSTKISPFGLPRATGDDSWGRSPGTYTAWRAGSLKTETGSIHFAYDEKEAKEYDKDSEGRSRGVHKYSVTIKNPLVADDQRDAHQILFGKPTTWNPPVGSKKTTAQWNIELDTKIAKAAKKKGYDSITYVDPRPPAARELVVLDPKMVKVEQFNPYHDTKTGKFASKDGGGGGGAPDPDVTVSDDIAFGSYPITPSYSRPATVRELNGTLGEMFYQDGLWRGDDSDPYSPLNSTPIDEATWNGYYGSQLAGVATWAGKIELRPDIHRDLQKILDGEEYLLDSDRVFDVTQVLCHETFHLAGRRRSKETYATPQGRLIEEGLTEIVSQIDHGKFCQATGLPDRQERGSSRVAYSYEVGAVLTFAGLATHGKGQRSDESAIDLYRVEQFAPILRRWKFAAEDKRQELIIKDVAAGLRRSGHPATEDEVREAFKRDPIMGLEILNFKHLREGAKDSILTNINVYYSMVEQFNPNHDAKSGKFTSKPGSSATVVMERPASSRDPLSEECFGYSNGSVDCPTVDIVHSNVPELFEKILKRVPSNEEISRLVGAIGGSEVSVVDANHAFHDPTASPAIMFNVHHAVLADTSTRVLRIDPQGNPYLENVYLALSPEATKGLGTRIFATQVSQAMKLGVKWIETYAAGARGESLNGYYTWARLGYDGPIPSYLKVKTRYALGDHVQTIQDVMRTPGGAAWWKDNGNSWEGKFHLDPFSDSPKILNDYLAAKGIRVE